MSFDETAEKVAKKIVSQNFFLTHYFLYLLAIKKQKQKIKNLQNKESFTEVESYFFDIEKCKHCPYKEGCYKNGAKSKTYNVTIKNDIHIKHMDYMKTEEFKELYAERYKIEAKNSELKSRFGYDKANVCGKTGITIQGASALFLANIKRIIKLKEEKVQNNVQKYPLNLYFL